MAVAELRCIWINKVGTLWLAYSRMMSKPEKQPYIFESQNLPPSLISSSPRPRAPSSLWPTPPSAQPYYYKTQIVCKSKCMCVSLNFWNSLSVVVLHSPAVLFAFYQISSIAGHHSLPQHVIRYLSWSQERLCHRKLFCFDFISVNIC